MKLLILETDSLVEAYKCLTEITDLGHSPLEFSPHAQGVRILFRAQENSQKTLPKGVREFQLSETVIKAYLGLGSNKLLEKMMVIEDASLLNLLETVQMLEDSGASVLEVRSFKSNSKFNHAIVTFNHDDAILESAKRSHHVVLDSKHPALKEFLGFTV